MNLTRPVRSLVLLGLVALALVGCGSPESRKQKYLAKGRAYVAQENWEKARIEFRNALQIVPTDAEARYENAFVAEKVGKQEEAVKLYQSALDVRADYPEASTRLARIFLLGGAPDRAQDVLRPALEKHPDDAQLLAIRAGVRGQLKDRAGALEDAKRAYSLAPGNEDVLAVLAGLYRGDGNIEEAVKTLEAGTARLPQSVDLRLALSQSYLDAGRPEAAEGVLKDLVKLQPEQTDHALRLARFYAQRDRLAEAEATLRDAVARNPASVPIRLAIVRLLAERKGKDAAETELKAQVAASPKLPELKFALAQFEADAGNLPAAEAVLKELIESEGKSASGLQARDSLAILRLRQNDTAGAEKLIGEVLAKSARDVQALSLRAQIALGKGDPKSAIADLRTVLRDQPNSPAVIRALAAAHLANNEPAQAEDALRRGADANPTDLVLRIGLIDFLSRHDKLEQARTIADDLAKRVPGNADVLEALFAVQLRQKDVAGAHATAALARTALPDAPFGDYLDGLAFEAEGKFGPALDTYAAALDRRPQSEDLLNAYAKLAVREGKTDLLLKRVAKISADNPKLVQPWQLAGEVHLGQKQPEEAVAAFAKAMELAPDRLAGYRGFAMSKLALGDQAAALSTLQGAVDKVGRPADALFEVAATLQQLKRTPEAIKAYEAVLAREPNYEAATNNLAMLLATGGDKAALDRAKTLAGAFKNAANPGYLDTYGWVLAQHGDYPEAIAVLSKLVEAHPGAAAFRYHLALAQIKSGDTAAGRQNLETALKDGRRFEGATEAQALLDSLGKG